MVDKRWISLLLDDRINNYQASDLYDRIIWLVLPCQFDDVFCGILHLLLYLGVINLKIL